MGWIGVDLDGTLAQYDYWRGEAHIGNPVPIMVERIKKWRSEGKTVKIFTARASIKGRVYNVATGSYDDPDKLILQPIREWCLKHIGEELPITNEKDFDMEYLWDDRCIPVVTNKGIVDRNPI